MNKKTNTAEPSAAGTAVPEKELTIPAHKRQYIARHGGSVVIDAPAVAVTAELNTTEEPRHAQKS